MGIRVGEMPLRILWEEILKRFEKSTSSSSRAACAPFFSWGSLNYLSDFIH